MDNVFVIAMIFRLLRGSPRTYQHRVLFWGILGVIVLRAIMIGVGADARLPVLLGPLHLRRVPGRHRHQDAVARRKGRPICRQSGARASCVGASTSPRSITASVLREAAGPEGGSGRLWFMTPLFLALVLIEIADVIFAVDSVPAIFAITTDPFIVYTSNIFAILGLRALYFALAAMMHRFPT
jgi:tellurite resistance protein TerC